MPKEIKKHYNFMDLSYSSSVDEIKEREKVMIKILRAKAIKKGISNNNKIEQVANSANQLVAYVEKNGISNIKDNMFETPKSSIVSQCFVLAAVVFMLICSIHALI